MKVGELYYGLGVQPDAKSFAAARQNAKRFGKQVERDAQGIGRRINRALFGTKGERDGQGRFVDGKRGLLGRGGAGKVLGRMGRFNVGGPAMMATGAVGAAGAAFGVAYKNAINFDDALTRLDISSSGAMGSMAQVREQILKVSSETGVAKEELLEGSAAFVALTGDGKAASQSLSTFARVQKATGADMKDIVGSAASLTEQLGIGAPLYEDAFSILVAGGKAGKIELNDMASLMASLGANFKQFAGSQGLGGLANLGAAFQITARNFGSASEAATGLESLMGSIIQHSGKLKEAGVNVFEADGKTLKSLEGIVDAITSKGFNPTELIDLLGRKEAYKTLQALRDNRDEWGNIAKETRNAKDIAVDYDKYNQSASAQLKKAWNGIKIAVTSALTPERVRAFTEFLKDAIATASKLVGTLSRIPGYVEFLQGEGAVARQDEQAAFEKMATNPEVQRNFGLKVSGKRIQGGDMDKVAEEILRRGLGSTVDNRDEIIAGAKAQLARSAKGREKDLDTHGFSPGSDARRMDVEASRFMESPTMMEADAARRSLNISTSIALTVDANADSAQFEASVKRVVEADREKLSREIASQLGQ